jgi:hypothetical protein
MRYLFFPIQFPPRSKRADRYRWSGGAPIGVNLSSWGCREARVAGVIMWPTAQEAVKNSKNGNFTLCNPLKIQVGARHGVPLRGFFHSFCRCGPKDVAAYAAWSQPKPLKLTLMGEPQNVGMPEGPYSPDWTPSRCQESSVY